MRDLDIILAAHGAGNGSSINNLVQACAQHLEATFVGARVTAAFHHGDPGYEVALRGATRPQRIVLPMLTSDGHYAEHLRGLVQEVSSPNQPFVMLPPLGAQPAFIQSAIDRVQKHLITSSVCKTDTQLLIIGHGTRRHPQSGIATRNLAEAIASQIPLPVHIAYLDQAPTIEHAVSTIRGCAKLLVLPFLFGGGDHANHDIPLRVAAALGTHDNRELLATFLEPIGDLSGLTAHLATLIYDACADRRILRVGARSSLLSQQQVALFAAAIAEHQVDVRFVPIETHGDVDLSTPIEALGLEDLFTGAINDALLEGQIDVAVHSMKDLPLDQNPRITNGAVLPRGSIDEVLVTRNGEKLSELSAGSRIGTSCTRRASQLRRLRPDLIPADIRGAVPDRIAALDRGEVDALILAAAGLERLGLHGRIAQHFDLDDLLPAPAQGAIVIQCLASSPALPLLKSVDDDNTHRAVHAELAFARAVAQNTERIAAAWATADGDQITLHARLIDPLILHVDDIIVRGGDADELGADALNSLLASGMLPSRELVAQ